MSLSSSTRASSAGLFLVIVGSASLVFGGCNSLLDNRRGDIGEDLFATETGDAGTASTEARRDAGAIPPAPGASGDDAPTTPALPPQCLVGTKPCGDLCVSTEDPFFGCGGPTCERCQPAHATAACAGASCALGACEAGWADCNGVAADGCEADLGLPSSCGACGTTCPAPGPNAETACVVGACVTQCLAGFGDCNANPADGCETDLLTDQKSCGGCGLRCIIGKCQGGDCLLKL